MGSSLGSKIKGLLIKGILSKLLRFLNSLIGIITI